MRRPRTLAISWKMLQFFLHLPMNTLTRNDDHGLLKNLTVVDPKMYLRSGKKSIIYYVINAGNFVDKSSLK